MDRLAEANDRLQEVNEEYERLSESFNAFKALVEQVGLTDVVGFRLRNQLALLPSVSKIQRRLRLEREEMHDAQSRRFDLDAMSFGEPKEDATHLLTKSPDPVLSQTRFGSPKFTAMKSTSPSPSTSPAAIDRVQESP